jgi:hypothetical protein
MGEFNRRDGSIGGNDATQATYLSSSISKFRSLYPKISGLFVYELLDEPYFGASGEAYYGLNRLVNRNGIWSLGDRKPAFSAVASAYV